MIYNILLQGEVSTLAGIVPGLLSIFLLLLIPIIFIYLSVRFITWLIKILKK